MRATARMLARLTGWQADRLAAAGVVGHRQHDAGNRVAVLGQEGLQPVEVHVALERVVAARIEPFGDDQVVAFGAGRFDVAARRVEMGVGRDHPAGPAEDREQDRLGRPALVGWDHMFERHQLLHRRLEAEEGRAAGVAFVARHERRLLAGAHGRGPAVGQQVDQHVVGVQGEQVVVGLGDQLQPFLARRHADRFDRLDAEGFNDGFHG